MRKTPNKNPVGRPTVKEKKKASTVSLRDDQKLWLLKKYKSLTRALESLLPDKLK